MNADTAGGQFRQAFAIAIRGLRAERGWNQRELCRRAELSPAYLSELESGRKDPSTEMIERFATAFGYDIERFTWTILVAMLSGEMPGVSRRDSALTVARETLRLGPRDRQEAEDFIDFLRWRASREPASEWNKQDLEFVDDTESTRRMPEDY